MALFGFGVQPGDNRNLGDVVHDRLTGNKRAEFYVVSQSETKPKKVRRAWLIFQKEPRVRDHAGGQIVREMMSQVNRRLIREDEWRRDQGGAVVGRGGYGVTIPEVDPGQPAGFYETPQVHDQGNPEGWIPGPL